MKRNNLIYIIEDDNISAYVIKYIVDQNESIQQSQIFANGQLAFDAISTAHGTHSPMPDIILLDINMPVMDGWQFLDAVATHIPQASSIPIYILSSSIAKEDKEKANKHLLVKGLMTKPLTRAAFEAVLNTALNS